ncbi:MAG: periplasmic heavy metal sensor [Thermoanaerobaculia bacterium]
MKSKAFFLLIALLAAAAWAEPAGPRDDPIAKAVFPPELVMKYSQEINLDERQRTAIKENVQKAQSKFVDVQFELQTESQKLARLLQAKPADEAAVLSQVDKVLALEREVKRTQIALVVRIKNLLTDAQQAKLMDLRRQE